ncbi:MAG: hypothetical protein ACAH95_11115 [Fimbriimonas sp.]
MKGEQRIEAEDERTPQLRRAFERLAKTSPDQQSVEFAFQAQSEVVLEKALSDSGPHLTEEGDSLSESPSSPS